jgi:hypothetical protein
MSLPGMVADFGHSLYRLGTDPKARADTWEQMKHPSQWLTPPQDAPTQQFKRALDQYLPHPETRGEKIGSLLLSMEGGALAPQIPVPDYGVPANFRTAAQVKRDLDADVLRKTQEAGYVVPPATTNPSAKNVALETLTGKVNAQNTASSINQRVRNAAAATDLGLNPELMTPGAVEAVKREAGNAIEQARSIPLLKTDDQYVNDLAEVLKKGAGANESFPGASNPDIEKVINTYLQPEFTGNAAVSATKLLRGKADDAFRTGNSELGFVYKGTARAIESQLQRGANEQGYADLAQQLANARKTYAIASTVEESMDPAGNVLGNKLAAAWNHNEPLSGSLLTAAEHAATFPKANGAVNASNVGHLSTYGTIAGAVAGHELTHSPWGYAAGAAIPMSRAAAKHYLFSPWGQAGGIPSAVAQKANPTKLQAIIAALNSMPRTEKPQQAQPHENDDRR